ncbi:hypothetical protein ACFVYE_45735 [Streptomyces sp. NPDC058239]|uniref:hypothetical protein n=1 Tax=Streptomyces sp. NPDC058239 TaxID=3346395 RepID=UPI0036ED93FE
MWSKTTWWSFIPPHPPVADLLRGQFLEDQLLVVVDVGGLLLRGGDDGGRAGCGQHDRGHQRGRRLFALEAVGRVLVTTLHDAGALSR